MKIIYKIIKKDWERYHRAGEKLSLNLFIRDYLAVEGFKYTVIFRLATAYREFPIVKWILRAKLKRLSHKFGIIVPIGTQVGDGLVIAHFGGIVVNRNAILGDNCYIRPNVVIGESKGGSPCIGNNVSIGAGAIIVGKIRIGNNVTIGNGSVVVKDVPDNATVVGNPGRIL